MTNTNVARLGLMAMACTCFSVAQAELITFDEFGAAPDLFQNTQRLSNEYFGSKGVIFAGPSTWDGGAILDQNSNYGTAAHSGRNFLAFNNTAIGVMANGGTPKGPETVWFATYQSVVSIWVAQAFTPETFTMKAYDSWNTVIDTDSVTTTDWAQLSVSASGTIDHVVLSYTGDWAIWDDLEFSSVPEPASMAALALGAAVLVRRRKR